MKKIKVATLFRVSSKQQLDNGDEIGLQQRAYDDFMVKHPDWERYDPPYYERGISAYKNSIFEREEMMELLNDAKDRKFDVLVVFTTDRLGRTGIETSYFIYLLSQTGIEIYSIREGKIDPNSQVGQIKLAVDTSSAQEESRKISFRVDTDHRQMVEDSIYRGGFVSHGYKLVRSSEIGQPIYNKKKKELLCMIKDEDHAPVIELIYDLAYEYAYGSRRISKILNKEGIKSPTGKKWIPATIDRMLRNPIYKGYLTYGKTSAKNGKQKVQPKETWLLSKHPNPLWIIINECKWDAVQEIREKNKTNNSKSYSSPTSSPLLLSGLIFCDRCGSKLTPHQDHKKWKRKDGTTGSSVNYYYRCTGRYEGKKCKGQSLYSRNKIEPIVINEVNKYLDMIGKIDINKYIGKIKNDKFNNLQNQIKNKEKELRGKTTELDALKNELPKTLTGKSVFTPELLKESIDNTETQINHIRQEINTIKDRLSPRNNLNNKIIETHKKAIEWKDIFHSASLDKQKFIISKIINAIYIDGKKIRIQPSADISFYMSNVV